MEPRWGGSYEKMEQIAMTAEPYYQANPRLTALYGKIYADRADYMYLREKGKEAVELYNKAIAYGDDWHFYRERARAYHFELKDLGRALKDINRSIAIRPNKSDNHITRSKIYFALERYAKAVADYDIARQLAPGDDAVKEWENWASVALQNLEHNIFKEDLKAAVGYYDTSLKFREPNETVYYWRGMAKHRLSDSTGALADFYRCLEINPAHFDSCRMIDSVLSRKGQWDTIIAHWTAFLEHEPNHGRAYYERSGAYIQKRDRDSAFSDLRKSCQLRYEDACKMLKGLQAKETGSKGSS